MVLETAHKFFALYRIIQLKHQLNCLEAQTNSGQEESSIKLYLPTWAAGHDDMRGDDEVGDGVEGDGHGHGHVLQQAAVRVQQRRGHVLRRPVTQSHQHLLVGTIHDHNL